MQHSYKTILQTTTIELEIQKSRFIAEIFYVESEEGIQNHLTSVRLRYPGANHYCYAYILKPERELSRFSDDGEPGGTAGQPIFHCLEQNDLTNVLVIVTRYFGGIKLGAGGLVRAYSHAASAVLSQSIITAFKLHDKAKITIDYHFLRPVQHCLNQGTHVIISTAYQDRVIFTVASTQAKALNDAVTNLTNGSAEMIMVGTTYLPDPAS